MLNFILVLFMTFKKKIFWSLFLLVTYCLADIESGVYIAGNAGYGFISNNTISTPTNNNSYTLGIDAGYAFDRYFAIDAATTLMPNNNGYGSFSNLLLSDVAFRASLPLSSFFSAYLHVGGGLLTNTSQGVNQFGLFTGLGGLFKINNELGLTAEDYGLFLSDNNADDINIFAIGVVYGF